jgi:hypothetical protein
VLDAIDIESIIESVLPVPVVSPTPMVPPLPPVPRVQ